MNPIIYTLLSVSLVSLISLIGIFTISIKKDLLQKFLFILVAVATGALFGDALINLIPETFARTTDILASLYILFGIMAFFALEKFLHWHHSHGEEHHGDPCVEEMVSDSGSIRPIGMLVLVSDGVHNFIDGMIIAASFLINPALGIATTVAIIFHEIPQEMGDFGLLLHAGFTRRKALFLNLLSGLFSLLGAGIILFIGSSNDLLIVALTGFAAGSFLYLAGSDLVPELQKNHNIRESAIQFIGILTGIAIILLLTIF